jgi:peptidyl-tRNA hydrolase, PTH1 family
VFAIAGLGNPGSQYAKTRHNAGFRSLEVLAGNLRLDTSAFKSKFGALFAKAKVAGTDTVLILPQQFMNNSGEVVVPLLGFFQIPLENLIVIYDELALKPGVVQLKFGGSSAGHNGVQDIIDKAGADKFNRLRVGIGHPRDFVEPGQKFQDTSSWVLGLPHGDHRQMIAEAEERAAQAALTLIEKGLEAAQRTVNVKR